MRHEYTSFCQGRLSMLATVHPELTDALANIADHFDTLEMRIKALEEGRIGLLEDLAEARRQELIPTPPPVVLLPDAVVYQLPAHLLTSFKVVVYPDQIQDAAGSVPDYAAAHLIEDWINAQIPTAELIAESVAEFTTDTEL